MGQTLAHDLTSPDLWNPERAPFSFKYGGKDSAQLLTTWQFAHKTVEGKDGQVQLYSYTDPATRLKITAEVRLYPDFPGVADWVLKLRNDGDFDTPIIEDILPLHWAIPAAPGDCILRHARGSNDSEEDFTPFDWRTSKPAIASILKTRGADRQPAILCPSSICKPEIMGSLERLAGREAGRPISIFQGWKDASP